jgi:hypothetical protein
MATYNFGERVSLGKFGRGIQLSADGFPKAKAGGITFDWTDANVVALAKDTYLEDQLDQNRAPLPGSVAIPAGTKVLRYGTPVERQGDGSFKLAQGAGVKGEVFLLNESVTEDDGRASNPIAIDGGRVFKDRILTSDSGNNVIGKDVDGADVTLSGLPTFAQLEAVLPTITYAQD